MKRNDTESVEILVLGNGFDIHCGLKSKFSEYYEIKVKNKMDNLYNLYYVKRDYAKCRDIIKSDGILYNFWNFLFHLHYYAEKNEYYVFSLIERKDWFDIESLIKTALSNHLKGGFYLEGYLNDAFEILKTTHNPHDYSVYKYLENPYIFFPFIQETNETNAYKYLLNELHKFENSFKNYLKEQINDEYNEKREDFLNLILKGYETVHIINFNYTYINVSMLVYDSTNVHGKLEDEEIIIGIDYSGEKKDQLIEFTKTYRNLHRLKAMIELPSKVNKIYFYGHSLAEADFSYFYSIFDIYKLYDGNLKLVFMYSDYCDTEKKNKENHDKYVKQICMLINHYSEISRNDDNLLHRLILEGRITIEKI